MVQYLSYPLNPADLVWPGEPTLQIEQCTKIEGDSPCNTFRTVLPNHCGTHYDAPWHFNANGPKISELPIEYFWFESPVVIDIPKTNGEGITAADIEANAQAIAKADILLIKTGYAMVRRDDPVEYQMHGSFIYPEAAKYLVEHFPNLRCIGFDFLSIGCPSNTLSPEAHQWLLGAHTEKFITAIEDMNLLPLYETEGAPKRVVVAPLRLVEVDSSQVTVFAEW